MFPKESKQYRAARKKLLDAEVALRRQTEEVAAMRRALPDGGEVAEDYVFHHEKGAVRLSELFQRGDTLVAYSFMYGPKMEKPCPMCTAVIDGLNGNAVHIGQRVSLIVLAKSPIERIMKYARSRSWSNLRLLSSESTFYNRDYHGESAEGKQTPILNVFVKKGSVIRHFYATEMLFAPEDPGQNARHVDAFWPLWNVLDMTPHGRSSDWYPKISYG